MLPLDRKLIERFTKSLKECKPPPLAFPTSPLFELSEETFLRTMEVKGLIIQKCFDVAEADVETA